VLGGVEVLRGVLVLRRVAATDVAAGEAEAEVDPAVAALETLLATVRRVRLAVELLGRYGLEVLAGHSFLPDVIYLTSLYSNSPYASSANSTSRSSKKGA
jgi:hypothetical protein